MRWLSTAARTCAPKRVYSSAATSSKRDHERDADQEQPIDAEGEPEDRHRAAQIGRHLHRLLDRAVDVGGDRDRHEDEADGEQHLVEIARAVEAAVEHALEHDADERGGEERERQRREERPPETVHQRDGDVAAEHREGAVREVDEIHHPQRHRQPDRQQEQQHPVGEAVEQDADHGADHGGHGRQSRLRRIVRIAARGCGDLTEACAWRVNLRLLHAAFTGSLTFSTLSNSTLTSSPPTFSTRRM